VREAHVAGTEQRDRLGAVVGLDGQELLFFFFSFVVFVFSASFGFYVSDAARIELRRAVRVLVARGSQ
jgi:hypothetical protein